MRSSRNSPTRSRQRDALDAVVDTVRQGRKAAAARKTERKKQIRQRLSALSQQRDEHRATLIPMTSSLEAEHGSPRGEGDSLCRGRSGPEPKTGTLSRRSPGPSKMRFRRSRRRSRLTKAAMDMLPAKRQATRGISSRTPRGPSVGRQIDEGSVTSRSVRRTDTRRTLRPA